MPSDVPNRDAPRTTIGCAATTGRLFLPSGHRLARREALTVAADRHPPIYAALVIEWQARGRMVPGAGDAQWDSLLSPGPAPSGRGSLRTAAAPPGQWERVVDLPTVRLAYRAPSVDGPRAVALPTRSSFTRGSLATAGPVLIEDPQPGPTGPTYRTTFWPVRLRHEFGRTTRQGQGFTFLAATTPHGPFDSRQRFHQVVL